MKFKKYYIVANTREEFKNESKLSIAPYSDHPSRKSIDFVINELEQVGFKAEFFGGIEALVAAYYQRRTFKDTMFLNFSDGLNQISRKAQSAILLELLGVPYAGSDPLARLMAGNKAYAKTLVSSHLNIPKGFTVFNQSLILDQLSFPVIVKPNREGSSLGIAQNSVCVNQEELRLRLLDCLSHYKEALVEEYIPGYEITCFIIGNRGDYYLTEPIICEYDGIRYFEKFVFGLEEKADRKRKEFLARRFLSVQQIGVIQQCAQTAFEILDMNDFARVDFRLNEDGKLFFIEINGNAVISETSEMGVLSRELGTPFGELVGNIIRTAGNRLNTNHG